MTDDLKAYEPAARELCRLMGVDPDDYTSHGAEPDENGYVPGVLLASPLWVTMVAQMKRTYLTMRALEAHPPNSEQDT